MGLGHRAMGVEFERLLLHRESRASAPLPVARAFLETLCEEFGGDPMVEDGIIKGFQAGDLGMSLEPGGQIEVASPPARSLKDLDVFFARVEPLLQQCLQRHPLASEYELVALGHAPVTPVEELGLLPRQRYLHMDALMPERGRLSRNMMRATAGFQLTYDVADRRDAGRKLALLNRLAPVLAAWTANSRMVGGEDSGFESFRHYVWLHTDTDRSGVPVGALDSEGAIEAYREYALDAHVLFRFGPGGVVPIGNQTLRELAASSEPPTREDVELHLSSLFPFVRLRNYVEVRCFDVLEWPEIRSVQAFLSGIVYCDHATARAEAVCEPLALRDPAELRALNERVARHGLDAEIGDERIRDFARRLLGVSGDMLGGESCDWAEPSDLEPLRARLDSGVHR